MAATDDPPRCEVCGRPVPLIEGVPAPPYCSFLCHQVGLARGRGTQEPGEGRRPGRRPPRRKEQQKLV